MIQKQMDHAWVDIGKLLLGNEKHIQDFKIRKNTLKTLYFRTSLWWQ